MVGERPTDQRAEQEAHRIAEQSCQCFRPTSRPSRPSVIVRVEVRQSRHRCAPSPPPAAAPPARTSGRAGEQLGAVADRDWPVELQGGVRAPAA